MLYGCTQTAANMEAAGWNALADQYKLTVIFAIALRGSIFAQQISDETMTTGARSVFMTARLVLD